MKLTEDFTRELNRELRRTRHPWAAQAANADHSIADGISAIHIGMRSRGGVPLNGAEAFHLGFAHSCCPYTWGRGPVPYWDLWSIEWQTAQQSAGRAPLSPKDQPL